MKNTFQDEAKQIKKPDELNSSGFDALWNQQIIKHYYNQ